MATQSPAPLSDDYHRKLAAARLAPNIWPMGRGVVMGAVAERVDALVLRAVPDGDAGEDPEAAWARSEELDGPSCTLHFHTLASVHGMIAHLESLALRMELEGNRD